jgi:hypothetical protein
LQKCSAVGSVMRQDPRRLAGRRCSSRNVRDCELYLVGQGTRRSAFVTGHAAGRRRQDQRECRRGKRGPGWDEGGRSETAQAARYCPSPPPVLTTGRSSPSSGSTMGPAGRLGASGGGRRARSRRHFSAALLFVCKRFSSASGGGSVSPLQFSVPTRDWRNWGLEKYR